MAGKQNNNQRKEADFGYFGKGIDGYVHYKQAFDRNFPKDEPDDLQSDLYSEMMRPKANPPKVLPAMTLKERVDNDFEALKAWFFVVGSGIAIIAIIGVIVFVACMIWLGLYCFLTSLPPT